MRKHYFNIFLDIMDKETALKLCFDALMGDNCKSLFFVNAHCFNVAQINAEYRNVLNNSDLIFNDGIGLSIGSFAAGVRFKDNLNGTDLIPKIVDIVTKCNKNIYIIGSYDGVAIKAKSVLEKQYENIKIVGARHGFFSDAEEEIIINDINSKKTDILIVGMGVPKQEQWINKIRNKLSSVKFCIAGGAIIDFMAGNIKRAPKWMRRHNLEWVYRLYLEPGRMWKRYLMGNILFFYNIGKHLTKK